MTSSNKIQIPVLDLTQEIDELWDELNAAIYKVLRSGAFIMGEDVKALEEELALYLGVQHAVALNSGTDALLIALRTLNIGPGDEVITTPFTFFATAEVISLLGASPIFVDIDPRTFNMDAAGIEAKITERTKAIVPVHLFGLAVDMQPILELAERYNLPVVEDVAQAFGGRYQSKMLGTLGKVNAFSFFPTKNLGAYGDGGLLTTNDAAIAETARMLRTHGSKKKYHNVLIGYNSRLDTLQAAILRVKLPHIDAWNDARRQAAARYDALLADIPSVLIPFVGEDATHVYHQYTIRVLNGKRDFVQKKMQDSGISTMVYYPIPVHRLPVYESLGLTYVCAEQAASEVLSLPIWAQITLAEQERVVLSLRDAISMP